ncbi:putative ABC transport system substrate-binding protein [Variovorax sp. HW608]|uniref:ABC transporter substrate-binding protein n=1 Tax=Variovorax sp. HW608 TaxID=1034889 RepID=UPI00081F8DBE|nr:ABC transporter substrate-binding protein [Variovorax sp. HW608]SCK27411.1 putative ABC transport system substrate-binding protein [Variovorax sp. HW608]
MMDRRTFIGSTVTLVATVSLPANAQSVGKVWRIGYIGSAPLTDPEQARIWGTFLETLRSFGYIEGQNLAFEMRFSKGNIERYPALAAELVRLNVDVIVVGSAPGARAAKEVTATIPIVMAGTSDPVGAGLVASLAHPGGNITGVADYQVDLIPKRLELLKTVATQATRVANLFGNFGGFDAAKLAALDTEQDAAAHSLGVTLLRFQMNTPQDFDATTAAVVREHPDALLLSPNPTNFILRHELAAFALKQRIPTMAARREEALAGMLMSYGPSLADLARHVAIYVDKIFKGSKPAELPVEQPTKFELVINMKTAKALGLAIPQSLLLRADEIIQ